jgi:hypothetical protein
MSTAAAAKLSAQTNLLQKLGPTSTVRERVQGLIAVLEVPFVAKTIKVSYTAVRKWQNGTEPRADLAMAIDDLRSVVAVLLEAGFEPSRIRSWLLSRDRVWLKGKRPIDCLADRPVEVLSAAKEAAAIQGSRES